MYCMRLGLLHEVAVTCPSLLGNTGRVWIGIGIGIGIKLPKTYSTTHDSGRMITTASPANEA